MIKDGDKRVSIKYLVLQESRILVRVEVVPSYNPLAIVPNFQEKIN